MSDFVRPYLILATIFFVFFASIWSSKDIINMIFKGMLWTMVLFSVIVLLSVYGFVLRIS